ncbi:MAG: glycosyltransferase [Desulfovibrio sp.]|jgi:glycosyltransferase involved in cell wall biosynthesis|nr:glycosyltransferase [Desulfovibrio sp.]
MPFFSIITATLNAAATLPRLLDSLACQTCRDFELIIQDGASSDNTVAIAESYRKRLPALSLVSVPDTGIYDAWNRALERARGEWVLFLGADDRLASSETLGHCLAALRDMPGSCLYAAGSIARVSRSGAIMARLKPSAVEDTPELLRERMPFPYPALWHRRSVFEGRKFDNSLSIAADYDFVCRTWTRENGVVIPVEVTLMRRGGVSDLPHNVLRTRWEDAKVASRHFRGVWSLGRVTSLAKACILWLFCKVCGRESAPRLLDAIRRLRGLPPAWRGL